MSLLSIKGLHISVDGTELVRGLNLEMAEGEIHAIMGPNGSGKSTLVSTLMGHPAYEVTGGSVEFRGEDLLAMEAHERAQAGLFLAFQYPKEIAGVTLRSFLYAAYNAQMEVRDPEHKKLSPIKFKKYLTSVMEELRMDPSFAERFLNQGFSGGEKKKAEILQMKVLQPHIALLDETDSGLDVDALKIVAGGINSLKRTENREQRTESNTKKRRNEETKKRSGELSKINTPSFSALIVTHYARILEHITPDHVHVMVGGTIVESGGADFARELEEGGYEKYL